MPLRSVLIANRGEIAIRIARSAADLGLRTVAVYSQDDALCLHTRETDEARPLKGAGPAPYLDAGQLVAQALEAGCDAVHPGYGFLSESADFAAACRAAGLIFVGPSVEALSTFGDKGRARARANAAGVPTIPGTFAATSLEDAESFLESLGPRGAVMIKALAGGGGRGMRPASSPAELKEMFARCASEAQSAFGSGELYVEEFFPRARHVEVQIIGDGAQVVHLLDRECSLQRNRQKLIEIAPAVQIPKDLRERLAGDAVRLAEALGYEGLGTVEFLVDANDPGAPPRYAFIEANARLQVEHTVTEEVLGLDLVRLQLEVAGGRTLKSLGLSGGPPTPKGVALQCRVNLETMSKDGLARPAGGQLEVYEPPSGPGVRVDGFGYAGYRTSARFDSLLAKVIIHAPVGGLEAVCAKADRRLADFRLVGVDSNIRFLRALLRRQEIRDGRAHTRFVEEHIGELVAAAAAIEDTRFFEAAGEAPGRGGVRLDAVDAGAAQPSEGAVLAPIQGTIVSLPVREGQAIRPGDPLAILESMKMEHVVSASGAGIVRAVLVQPGETVAEGAALILLEVQDCADIAEGEAVEVDLDEIRPDLAEVIRRHAFTLDQNRPQAVARRRATGQRTARENIADLVDPGSFAEYGALTIAGRLGRNSREELIETTPADGLIMGVASINGALFPEDRARAAVVSYDYTVLAGTQGVRNHLKTDRIIELAHKQRLPLVFFAEGGGGRPGDTDRHGFVRAFELLPQLSANAPLIGVASGRCFAGNAAILGCCDVIIAAKDATLGMGGPAMVEGGGLGVFTPEQIGPVDVQQRNGVIDILVEDEAEAVAVAKQYLGYFQGRLLDWSCADQRWLRRAIPENRLRIYDIRSLIRTLSDEGSFLEIRPQFGVSMVVGFVRIEGRPLGLIANNPQHLGGAIDSDASDKAARFLQICEAFDLPVLSLSDTPGNMVGPEAEKTGLVRHCSRLFLIGANLTVPIFSVVLRKSYGLGAIAMTGGSYQAARFVVAWPTGEFGGMGLEGSVKLGFRKELEAIADTQARKARFDQMVAAAYEEGKALSFATSPRIDGVIDPADTRKWILAGLKASPPPARAEKKKLSWIDAW
jgi:acetyl/propionyl-CoA carboxylase alpha subunit/acetyl-CoA carboxylase carboxyltransferase component